MQQLALATLNLDKLEENKSQLKSLIKPYLSAKKDRHNIHKIFSYPAKFQGYLPQVLIENLTVHGDLICDPYSGGGTTSATSALLGRNCYGIDLNPIAVIVSKAKSTQISTIKMMKCIDQINALKPLRRKKLSKDEWNLMGNSLSQFVEAVWAYLGKKDAISPLIGTLLIKRIKLACRRDKTHLRTATFAKHIEYVVSELKSALLGFQEVEKFGDVVIDHGSNHEMSLKTSSVDLIVTSPPYPGVDVEYNLIQLQRRDLNRCFRSDIGVRIAESILGRTTGISKKDLCDGGSGGGYWSNTELSLKEMFRVLKKNAMAFLYIGFKTDLDRLRFEKLLKTVGFELFDSFKVKLGKERVASSRGLFHGRDTSMMKADILYVLRKS